MTLGLWGLSIIVNTVVLAYPSFQDVPSAQRDALANWSASQAKCRILLVGSSPVVFGQSAHEVQAATGCDTANLAALSVAHVLNVYLDNLLDHVRPGDIVVLSDRLWTQPQADTPPCEAGLSWRCLTPWFRLVPNLNEALVRLRGTAVRRDVKGDLLEFPALPPDPMRPLDRPLDKMPFRLERIEAQVQAIRDRGARPVLAPTPLLARRQSLADVQRDLAAMETLVKARVGEGVWIAPLISTDLQAATIDGQHASAAGRRQWTALVATALQKQLTR